MSQALFTVDDTTYVPPLTALLETLAALGITFRREGEGLAMRSSGPMTLQLRAAAAAHKPMLLALCDLCAEVERLHGYIIRLRCSDPMKGSRAQAIRYQAQQIEKLAGRSREVGGTADGWPDPADPFADEDQIIGLRAALDELEAGPYPIPLPAGCVLVPQANFDVFAAGRLYNGMVKTAASKAVEITLSAATHRDGRH